jgi:hypothetical protein
MHAWMDRPKTQIRATQFCSAHFFGATLNLTPPMTNKTKTKTKATTPRSSRPVRKKRKTESAKQSSTTSSSSSSSSSTRPKPLIFQDVMQQLSKNRTNDNDNEDDEESDVSLAFFELANAPTIAYRLPSQQKIVLQQDVTACGEHTGGIVWETSFLLLNYLLQLKSTTSASTTASTSTSKEQYQSLGRTIEVGAGCGLLGQVLAAANCSSEVIVTETEQVLVNLQANLDRNNTAVKVDHTTTTTTTTTARRSPVRACCLDWEHYERDAAANNILPHSCDTILGTDVLFATRFVRPLLETLQFLSIAPSTSDTPAIDNTDTETTTTKTKTVNIYLCVQIRCAASHKLFLDEAPSFGFDVHDISDECFAVPSCAWGRDLECKVFRMTTTSTATAAAATTTTTTKNSSTTPTKVL